MLKLEGRLHDGLVDSHNIARIIAEMERNPEKMFLEEAGIYF